MLSSTSCFSIIFNTIFIILVLREPLFKTDLIGIFMICLGSTLFLVSARNDDVLYTSDELQEIYMRPKSITFIVGSLVCLVVSLSLEKCINAKILKYYNERKN